MRNVKLKTLDYFSGVPAYDFGVFGANFPKFPLYQIPIKQGSIAQSSEGLGRSIRPHLMRNVGLETLDYFSCVP